jgi:hypothetical protein
MSGIVMVCMLSQFCQEHYRSTTIVVGVVVVLSWYGVSANFTSPAFGLPSSWFLLGPRSSFLSMDLRIQKFLFFHHEWTLISICGSTHHEL